MTSKFNLLGRASRGVCLAALALAIGLSATTPTFAQDGGPPSHHVTRETARLIG